jgi:thiol-disulfide isomerase/thioredoxin
MTDRRRSRHAPPPKRTANLAPTTFDPRWIIGGVAVVLVGAAVAAVLLTRSADLSAGSASTLRPAVSPAASTMVGSGASLPVFAATTGDPAIGRPIPEVQGASFDGSSVAIHADGRPKLLLFLAHWCPHCQREVPVVQAWLDAGRLPGAVDLISVATASDPARPNYPPADWLRREHWQPPVLVDADNAAADRFGLSAFPYWVAVRSDGTVASRVTGELTPAQLDALAASVAR